MLRSLQSIFFWDSGDDPLQGALMSAKEFAPQAATTISDRRPVRPSLARSVGAAALLVILSLPIPRWLVHGESLSAQGWREVVFWVLTLVLLAYVLLVERRPLSSIGLKRPSWKTAVFGVLGALVMVGGMAFIYLVIYPALGLSPREHGMAAVTALPLCAEFNWKHYFGCAWMRTPSWSRME
jgi:hypothetical protein